MRKVPLSDDVEAGIIARGTPGFSGADLANLVNEAALFAARAGKRLVEMVEFESAKDKIMMGAERRSMVMSDEEKRNTAYHEAGHAIVGKLVPGHDPVYKVTIIPRGRALGVTMFLPEEDRYSLSRQRIKAQICGLFGGRIAEEMILGPDFVTTGASNDIERATGLARNMVTKWGLSEKLGPLMYDEDDGEVFLGMSAGVKPKPHSQQTAQAIDEEVRRIIDDCYGEANRLLTENEDKLHSMANALIEFETLLPEQIDDIMAGAKPRQPKTAEDGQGQQVRLSGTGHRRSGGRALGNRPIESRSLGVSKKHFGTDGHSWCGRGVSPSPRSFACVSAGPWARCSPAKAAATSSLARTRAFPATCWSRCWSRAWCRRGRTSASWGPMPTPAVAYLTRTLRADAGIVVSASHNPYGDNGIKFFDGDGNKLDDGVEAEIERQLGVEMVCAPSDRLGRASRIEDAAGRYIEFCKATAGRGFRLHGLRIVLDCAHGATYHVAPGVFEELGAEITVVGASPNGFNINAGRGSSHPQHLAGKVRELGADLGIAFDGDGDRVIMVDAKGEVVDGDELLYLIASHRQRQGVLQGGRGRHRHVESRFGAGACALGDSFRPLPCGRPLRA